MQNLHSRYNPRGEAERYLDNLNPGKEIKIFILIEPGMGYLIDVLRNKNPNARIIALYAGRPPLDPPPQNCPDSFWFYGNGDLRFFLEQEIPDLEAGKIKIIEWRPALAVYGELYRNILSETAEFIKQADAGARTQNQFGGKWFKNFFRNLNIFTEFIKPPVYHLPFIITGAGPGLEETIPEIRKKRDSFFLLAVSSSAAALREADLFPDLVIAIDGGGWALLHLYESIRGNPVNCNYAISMTAAVPSQCSGFPVLAISDSSLWQALLLNKCNIPFTALPQRGTVSASALDLAFTLTKDKVFFTGLDLSDKDIQSHARPYSFDRLWFEKASRIDPFYSCVYKRTRLIREGGSHNIYASWFSRQLEFYPRRLFSLGANNSVFRNLSAGPAGIGAEPDAANRTAVKPLPQKVHSGYMQNPAGAAADFLVKSLTNSQYGGKLCEELNSLLSPADTLTPGELGEKITGLTGSYLEHG